jgi:hypothetical protein
LWRSFDENGSDATIGRSTRRRPGTSVVAAGERRSGREPVEPEEVRPELVESPDAEEAHALVDLLLEDGDDAAPTAKAAGRPRKAVRAPMATALRTSLPRRKPLSIITVSRRPTASMTSGRISSGATA